MSNVDKTLIGSNFCGLECTNKNNTIHPQTCTSQVLKTHDSNFTLVDWINYKNTEESVAKTFQESKSLLDWLQNNYPHEDVDIPIAGNTTLGAIMLGENNRYLEIDQEGVLSFKSSSLPTIDKAAYDTAGAIYLGNDSIMEGVEFTNSDIPITDDTYYCLPLVRDDSDNNRAGIAIPKDLFTFTQDQANWNESQPESPAYIKNKPSNLTDPATDNTLGGIKLGYSYSLNNFEYFKSVQTDANNRAYVQTYNPKSNIINNGLSQHYFDINSSSTGSLYIPLFKIVYNLGSINTFHVNTRFEIIGLRTQSYYGEFLLNYTYNPTSVEDYCEDLITLNLVGNSILTQTNVIAIKGTERENPSITIYRVMQTPTDTNHNMFMVNILSSNIPNSGNAITYYYCTSDAYTPDNNEVRITLADIPTQNPDHDNEINLVPNPS